MKPRNFPGRKALRQVRAEFGVGSESEERHAIRIESAKTIRSKKYRGGRGR